MDAGAAPPGARVQGDEVEARGPAAEARLRRATSCIASASTRRRQEHRLCRRRDVGGGGGFAQGRAASAAGGGAGEGRRAPAAGPRRQRDGVLQPPRRDRRLPAMPPRAGAAYAEPRRPLLRPMIEPVIN